MIFIIVVLAAVVHSLWEMIIQSRWDQGLGLETRLDVEQDHNTVWVLGRYMVALCPECLPSFQSSVHRVFSTHHLIIIHTIHPLSPKTAKTHRHNPHVLHSLNHPPHFQVDN